MTSKLVLPLIALILIAGCAGQSADEQPAAGVEDRGPAQMQPPVTPTPPPSTSVAPPPSTGGQPIQSKPVAVNPLKDPNNILSKRSVFFDYDSYVVKDEFKPLVTAHAQYLTQNRSARAVIQGNTDERGSREYNLALGQRRADSVKQMMLLLGVQEAQIETVSFGEEKPRATGTDEAAFSENRRDDIVYQGE